MSVILRSQGCTAKELQLMKFYGREFQRVNALNLVNQHLVALTRKPQNKVRSAMYSALGGKFYGTACRSEVVTSIYAPQCRIVARLHAILYGDIFFLRQVGKVIQLFFIDAIGACADYNTRHIGMRKCLIVTLPQALQRGVSI